VSKRRRDPRTTFGWYLRARMDARGYASDGDLEAVSGVSASLISRYQSGDISPTVQNLRKLAPFLDVTLGELMVEAGLATAEELGMVAYARPADSEALDRSLLEAQRLLADPTLSDEAKDYLRDTVRSALVYWRQQLGLRAPREPSAADRAAGRKVRAD
jgi:transcriptional regulator with XRE-family HTH domain